MDTTSQKDSQFSHLMLDIETMGTESFSSIVSIGAVEFDPETGETGKEFYANIDLQSCLDCGLTVSASTINWWLKQSEQARKDLTKGKVLSLAAALLEFANFCNKDYEIWGNSARFDCGILQNAYTKLNLSLPWDYRKERCVRTLVSFRPEIKQNFVFKGTAHNALADCYHQIGYCSEIYRSLHFRP
jgi:DNA polymerase III epsilon subunit-like protein